MANNSQKKNPKIRKYRKPLQFNVGMMIFLLIFLYMAVYVYTYLKKEKVQFYEVVEGSIVENKRYQGILFREESVHSSEYAGTLNYYVKEGKRASAGTMVYSVDEAGSMEKYLKNNPQASNEFSKEGVRDLQKQLSAFSASYDDDNFFQIYDLKSSMEAAVAEHINWNTMDNVEQLLKTNQLNFKQARTEEAGVVSYYIDSYESLKPEDVTMDKFQRTDYKKQIVQAGTSIGKGDSVYKLVTSDLWSMVFPMDDEDLEKYSEKKSLTVKFSGDDLDLNGSFSIFVGADGKSYGKIDFTKYMIRFVSERFAEFEIITDQARGLKIPSSAVTTKEFYLIPKEYKAQGGDTKETGFYREVNTDGKNSIVFVPVEIYNEDEKDCYIDAGPDAVLTRGDYIVKQNSTDRYKIGDTGMLEGVYNINKGYAAFKQIEVLSGNDEYEIVRKNTSYGLAVFDHIVLNANTIQEGDNIFGVRKQEKED